MGKARREKNKRLRHDRKISRDRRNSVKRAIAEFVDKDNASDVFNVLFVLKDTNSMEEVFLNIKKIEHGYFLNLPSISASVFKNSEDSSVKDIIYNTFGIKSDNIELINNTRLIVVKDFTVNRNLNNFTRVIVRPYSYYTWYRDNCLTSIDGFRIYSGNELKNYFRINNTNNLFVYQHTLTKLALYKIHMKKIDALDFWDTYGLYRYYRPNSHARYYDGEFAVTDNKFLKMLAQEQEEIKEFFGPEAMQKRLK